MELQRHAGNYYRLARDIGISNQKTGDRVLICVGEPIPKKILEDDDLRERLIRERRIVMCSRDGHVLEATNFIKLTQQDMKKMIDDPDQMVKDLVKLRFTNGSLLSLRRVASVKGLQPPYLKAIDEAIERL